MILEIDLEPEVYAAIERAARQAAVPMGRWAMLVMVAALPEEIRPVYSNTPKPSPAGERDT